MGTVMFEAERKQKMLEYIRSYSSASVRELSQRFQVSESTVRRDLQELESSNIIKRTHGGAVCFDDVNIEPTFREKEDRFRLEKAAIAKKAVDFIEKGDTILIDSGTTTLYMANELRSFSDLTVVTNSIALAQSLQGMGNIQLVVVGGILRNNTLAMVGPLAEQVIGQINVNKAFIATNAIDVRSGLTTPNLMEAATKAKMISVAKKVFLLADHTKIGKVSFAKFAGVSELDTWIVDDQVPQEKADQFEEAGVEVCMVQP
ncbi:MAG: transcriptional regulator, DeoR family [Firmicutes bacterium]|nr:transcriptional regulator, DeoR family [Bacillota bacterium]